MLELSEPQMLGHAANEIVELASSRADEILRDLLIESISRWAAENFYRFDDQEVSCTVRVYDWCERVRASRRGELILFHIQYDGPLPSKAMRLGDEHVESARRPDLTIKCGLRSIHIEAKLLRSKGGLPRLYVKEGMMRFIDGIYVSPGVRAETMISYVLDGGSSASYDKVNAVVTRQARLGPDHVTKELEDASEAVTIYESDHDSVRILHYAINMSVAAGGP